MKDFSTDKLYFIPLGGCGVFGANLSLYGTQGKWIAVDCGMGFGDETMPGVDILVPDPQFLKTIKDDILALFITHGHEDHIGGIQHIWQGIDAPIYATPFASGMLDAKMGEQSWFRHLDKFLLPEDKPVDIGPFSVSTIKMNHSIPEMRALKITAENVGCLLHTGDWKLDDHPVAGDVTDETALRALANDNILTIVGDSTNAMVPGHSGSEQNVQDALTGLFADISGRIAVSCFSSNIARLVSIAKAAEQNNRHVALVGRSLWRNAGIAKECGYLDGLQEFIEADDADYFHADQIVYVCTGSQGESRAALSRIADGKHRHIDLGEGDIVLFSSRTIPGNEQSINRVKNRLLSKGVDILTDRDEPIHVSGHPYREEIKQLITWVSPNSVLPVHGEFMQMERHAELAESLGVQAPVIPLNGDVIEVSKEGLKKVGEVPAGMLALDGKRLVPTEHQSVLTRRRLTFHGAVLVSVLINSKTGDCQDVQITALGVLDEDSDVDTMYLNKAVERVRAVLTALSDSERQNDKTVKEKARIAARRYFEEHFERNPQTRVHLFKV